uniref:Uncharacterized protein n=1 Tax=Heterorhabditis bacteriophora TaxID=37862 RepID=A0A1I7WX16_HETBA
MHKKDIKEHFVGVLGIVRKLIYICKVLNLIVLPVLLLLKSCCVRLIKIAWKHISACSFFYVESKFSHQRKEFKKNLVI